MKRGEFLMTSSSYHSKRHPDPDSAWNLHLFAIQTSALPEWKYSRSDGEENKWNFSLHVYLQWTLKY